MAQPSNRNEFKDYCLRRIGFDNFDIEIAEETIDDRINDALQFWYDWHFEGSFQTYYKYQLTQTDVDNRYITMPDNTLGSIEIFDLNSTMMGGGIFNAAYQFVASDIVNWFRMDSLIPYVMAFQYIQLMEEILVGKQPIRYSRYMNKLYIDADKNRLVEGNWIIVKCYQVVDPETYTKAWSNRSLQDLASALLKKQWAVNFMKFDGVKTAGGVDFNTDKMLEQAEKEIAEVKQEIKDSQVPVGFLIG